MNRISLVAIAVLGLAGGLAPTLADDGITIKVERFDRDAEVAIQRGYSVATAACAKNLAQAIIAYGGVPTGWTMTFDKDEAVHFNTKEDRNFSHHCIEGKQITLENGAESVVQTFDQNGEPTMEEQ